MSSSDWSHRHLSDFVSHLDAGVSVNSDDRPRRTGEVGVLKTSALSGGTFRPDQNKTVLVKERRRVAISVEGDCIIVSRMNTPDLVGESAYVPDAWPDLFLPDRLWLLRFRDKNAVCVRWLSYVLASPPARAYVSLHATGTSGSMKNLSKARLLELPVLSPPVDQQRCVAAVLHALDSVIGNAERIVAKLKQIEQGLLHNLLTRGVDDDGELRPSPDESPDRFKDSPVGRVPRSWNCSSVDNAFDVQPGLTLGPHRVPRNSPFPYLRVANVFKGHLDLSDVASLNARPFEVAHQLLRVGDLLLVEGHANIEEIGRVALADERVAGFTYQNHLFRLRPHTLEPDYCELWLNGSWVRTYWRRMCSTSSGLNTINQHTLKAIPVPIPSREERGRITATAEMCSTRISTENAVLTKYRNLKAGLMDDLLSGRVRLRVSAEPRG